MFPFDPHKPVGGQASIEIPKPITEVFNFIGDGFFDNYPKWAPEVLEFEPLDGRQMFVGAKAKQLRRDQGQEVLSVFEITAFNPTTEVTLKGITEPYVNRYRLEHYIPDQSTQLTFAFELLELELFMRPFEKLIRIAIEEGAEQTVSNIKNLLIDACT
jgi:hypothetical protein